MKALVVAMKPVGLYFVLNADRKMDLLKPQSMINGIDVKEQTDLCRTQKNVLVKTFLVEEPHSCLVKWDGKCTSLTPDAFYALQVYGVKAQLIGIHRSFDADHIAEKNFTAKLIGLLEVVFHQCGGIHAHRN